MFTTLQLRYGPHKGRLVFAGHNAHSKRADPGGVCVWFSDDHGKTYQANKGGMVNGNEVSIAQIADSNSTLYMNGRGTAVVSGRRADYRSVDGGVNWSAGKAGNLTDVNCEAAVVAMYDADPPRPAGSSRVTTTTTTLFFSEPHGPGRRSLRIYCSRDHGKTWPSYIEINRGEAAEYSALLVLPVSGPRLGDNTDLYTY
jgi:hypothetical protein